MAWSASAWHRACIKDALDNTAAIDLGADSIKCALYNNSITPDKDASSANSAYNAGQWATASNEVYQAIQWPQGGVALTTPTWTNPGTGVSMLDAADTASGAAFTTPAATYGCLHYDDTLTTPVADQGICFNYFGGSASVTGGILTVIYNASGIARITG